MFLPERLGASLGVLHKQIQKRTYPIASLRQHSSRMSTRKRKRGAAKASAVVNDDAPTSASVATEKPVYNCWLMKSEPEPRFEKGIDVKFGIEDLKAEPKQTACWDGVRNYQARNFMRDMKLGQEAFFYHSNCKEPGIAGIMKIAREKYPDHTQFDKKDAHYDPKSTKENPKWDMVDVQFVRMLSRYIPLSELKALHQQHKSKGGALANVALFTRARLSVQPLTQGEWNYILSLEKKDGAEEMK